MLELVAWIEVADYVSVGNYLSHCSGEDLQEFQRMQYEYLKNVYDFDFNADYIRLVAILLQSETSDEFSPLQLIESSRWFIDMVAVERHIREANLNNNLTKKFHTYATISDYKNFVEDLRKTKKNN